MDEIRVLIPIDLTFYRTTALQFGIYGAQRWGWVLHLLDIFIDSPPLEEAIQELLASLHREHPGISVEGESVQGNTLDIILEKSLTKSYALLLLEANDTQAWGYHLLGDQSLDLADRCSVPILTVPVNYTVNRLTRLGILTGFQEPEIDSLRLLTQLFDRTIAWVIFHVFYGKEEEARLLFQLQDWEFKVKGNVDQPLIKFLLEEHTDLKSGIAKVITEEGLDILVITSIYKGFFRKLFSKDYFKELMLHPPTVPTLYVKCN